jgi:M6 family metalloprotease-like protein
MGMASLDASPAWAGLDTDLLFIAVGFTDVPCTFTGAQHQTNMFGGGASGPGDLDDYFREISYGAFDVQGTVVGCFTLSNTKAYYDTGVGSDDDLVNEAIALADPTVDFSNFDNDSNGVVDALGIIYAGGGPHDGCDTDDPPSGSGGATTSGRTRPLFRVPEPRWMAST